MWWSDCRARRVVSLTASPCPGMYATCLSCNGDLGRNDVVEHFPVGRRLAYDAARGRLWVVCRRCERWNLTPLEERWEAIEDAERLYRGTRLRAATEHVGLARVGDGVELVRIGAPLRPEFAAWRYGDQFGRRRRRYWAMTAGAATLAGGVWIAGPTLGMFGVGTANLLYQAASAAHATYRARRVVRIPIGDGSAIDVREAHVRSGILAAYGDGRWRLELPARRARIAVDRPRVDRAPPALRLEGLEAIRAAAGLLPRVNRSGAGADDVREAVGLLEAEPDPERLFGTVAREARRRFRAMTWPVGEEGALATLPLAMRLALEMAAHEDRERRALEGELAELERAWQEAEEIAAIADDLLLPTAVTDRLARLRGRRADAPSGGPTAREG